MTDCPFCKMVSGEINVDTLYEDEQVLAFRDINPQAPLHALIIPKTHLSTLNDVTQEQAPLLGRMMHTAVKLAAQEGYDERGYRCVINCNAEAGQSVFHIHLHLLAGRPMHWPPG